MIPLQINFEIKLRIQIVITNNHKDSNTPFFLQRNKEAKICLIERRFINLTSQSYYQSL